jgi:MFS family permease
MIAGYLDTLRAANHNARLVLMISVIMGFTIDGGIYAAILNLYILRLNFGPEFVGQISSAANLIFALGSLAAGWLGSRFGDRRIMIVGLFLATAGACTLPMADTLPHSWRPAWLAGALLFAYIGLSFYFVNSGPFLIRATAVAARGNVFAMQSALSGVAGFAGGLVGGLLPAVFVAILLVSTSNPAPYRVPLLVAGAFMAVAAILVLQTRDMPDDNEPEIAEARPGAPRPRSAYRLIIFMMVVRFLQVAGVGAAVTFFNVYMDAGLGVATATIGIVSATARLLAVPAALLGPSLSRRIGYGPAAVVGSLGAFASLLPMAFIPSPLAVGTGFIALMAFTSVRYPAFYVFVMERTPPRLRATMTGTGEMAAGFSFAMISLAGGYIIVHQGYGATFLLSALITLAGTFLFAAYVWYLARRPASVAEPAMATDLIAAPLVGPVAEIEGELPRT